jgi:hypothetical protein
MLNFLVDTEKAFGIGRLSRQFTALKPDRDCRPCPFKGEVFQWMRNVVLADN